jgi:hypothetical protein
VKTIDELANVIRTVDGNNTMGAGELAEKIANHFALVPLGDVPDDIMKAVKLVDHFLNEPKIYNGNTVIISAFHIIRAALLAKATEGN